MLTRIRSILLLIFIPISAFAQYADNTPAFGFIRPTGAGRVVHILDIVLKDNVAYAAGTGGLWTINVANISSPQSTWRTSPYWRYRPWRSTNLRHGAEQQYSLLFHAYKLYGGHRRFEPFCAHSG